jgi:hypothetical protein
MSKDMLLSEIYSSTRTRSPKHSLLSPPSTASTRLEPARKKCRLDTEEQNKHTNHTLGIKQAPELTVISPEASGIRKSYESLCLFRAHHEQNTSLLPPLQYLKDRVRDLPWSIGPTQRDQCIKYIQNINDEYSHSIPNDTSCSAINLFDRFVFHKMQQSKKEHDQLVAERHARQCETWHTLVRVLGADLTRNVATLVYYHDTLRVETPIRHWERDCADILKEICLTCFLTASKLNASATPFPAEMEGHLNYKPGTEFELAKPSGRIAKRELEIISSLDFRLHVLLGIDHMLPLAKYCGVVVDSTSEDWDFIVKLFQETDRKYMEFTGRACIDVAAVVLLRFCSVRRTDQDVQHCLEQFKNVCTVDVAKIRDLVWYIV